MEAEQTTQKDNHSPPSASTPDYAREIRSAVLHDAWATNWSRLYLRSAALCLPVIAGWVFVGIISGGHQWALYAVAGSVMTGFGAFQRLGESRVWPLIVLILGLAAATWIGSVAGSVAWYAVVIIAAACGYGFGAMTMLGYGPWWVGLQWMIALLAFGSQPAGPAEAGIKALAVLSGGTSQLVFISLVQPFAARWFGHQDQLPLNSNDSIVRGLLHHAHPARPGGHYALRVAAAMAVATFVSHFWDLPDGYWTSMTAAILIRPDFHEGTIRGISRLAGTLAGAGVTTALLAALRPNQIELGAMLLVAVWGCFALMRVNYALFVTCVTSYIVLLFSTIGLPDLAVAQRRVEATLAGAAIAFFASLYLPLKTR